MKGNGKWRRRRVREGTEESAKHLCLDCVRKTANGTEGQALSDVLSDAANVFHETGAPSPPSSGGSGLSYLIRSNHTTLHGGITNQVTNRAPLRFVAAARFLTRLSSLFCVTQTSLIYFRTPALRITQGHYNSSLYALWKRLMWCALLCLPKRKHHFYLLKRWEAVFVFCFLFFGLFLESWKRTGSLCSSHWWASASLLYFSVCGWNANICAYVYFFFLSLSVSLSVVVYIDFFRMWIIFKCRKSAQITWWKKKKTFIRGERKQAEKCSNNLLATLQLSLDEE